MGVLKQELAELKTQLRDAVLDKESTLRAVAANDQKVRFHAAIVCSKRRKPTARLIQTFQTHCCRSLGAFYLFVAFLISLRGCTSTCNQSAGLRQSAGVAAGYGEQ